MIGGHGSSLSLRAVISNVENLTGCGTNTTDIRLVLEWKIWIRFQSCKHNRGSQGFNPRGGYCHIPEFWLSPTLMNPGHLQSHLQSYIATSPYAREVVMIYFTNIDILYITQFLYSVSFNSEYNEFLVLCRYLIFYTDFVCYLFSTLSVPLFLYLSISTLDLSCRYLSSKVE